MVLSRTVRTTGVPESALAERLGSIEGEIAPLTLAYLPSTDGVDLRLTAWSLEQRDAETRLTTAAARLQQLAGEHWYGHDEADLAAVVLEALRRNRQRLGVAESCTGGMVAERITNIPGASDTFIGGVVAYADVIKTAALKVPLETLQAHGSVSEDTVRAMAEGAQRLFSTEASIAVTGIAGPGGGTPEKPVGTVWLAARVATDTRAVGEAAAIAVGGTVGLDAMFGGPISGASMNPARSIGPALVSGNLHALWLYILAPILGTSLGATAYQVVRGERPAPAPAAAEEAPEPH